MSGLEIVFSPAARREIKKFDKQIQIRFIKAVEALSLDPRPSGAEKIQGHPGFLRIRAGADHRIIYSILQDRIVVIVVLRDRKDAYRGLGDLDDKLKAAMLELAANGGTSGSG